MVWSDSLARDARRQEGEESQKELGSQTLQCRWRLALKHVEETQSERLPNAYTCQVF